MKTRLKASQLGIKHGTQGLVLLRKCLRLLLLRWSDIHDGEREREQGYFLGVTHPS